ncbi:MAG: FAD-binding oxidoreductase [Deltaproteobacteria bacterium]|nr:FAD-binding oxidoreductase [Deltaproteobacteria bacterium]
MGDLKEKLKRVAETIGPDRIETDPSVTEKFAVDGQRPKGVVFPRNTREASEGVKLASRENLSLIPRGSGTKMGMGYPPSRVDLIMGSSRMDHMLDVDTANLTITVEAGVKFRDIQARLATEDDRCYLPLEDLTTNQDEPICSERANSGCFLPMDPPFCETATLGGIVATNSSGPRRLLYRFPRDQLLGVRFVAPGGDIIGTGGKTVKNVSGYDISKLMVGSAGSLGFISEMTFKLLPLPEHMETLFLMCTTLGEAAALTEAILNTPLFPAAVEIMNPRACEMLSAANVPVGASNAYGVAVAMEAFAPAVKRMTDEIQAMGKKMGTMEDISLEEDDHRRFWLTVSHLQNAGHKGSGNSIAFQLTYPISLMTRVVSHAEKALMERNVDHSLLVHGGTGACVVILSADPEGSEIEKTVVPLVLDLLTLCRREGGNLMVLNAPPALKSEVPMWGEVGDDLQVMKRIKTQVDPSGIFSPGRFVGGL